MRISWRAKSRYSLNQYPPSSWHLLTSAIKVEKHFHIKYFLKSTTFHLYHSTQTWSATSETWFSQTHHFPSGVALDIFLFHCHSVQLNFSMQINLAGAVNAVKNTQIQYSIQELISLMTCFVLWFIEQFRFNLVEFQEKLVRHVPTGR